MDPLLCSKGCGFYGSVENKNMCSKCFKDYLKEEVIAKSGELINLSTTSINSSISAVDDDHDNHPNPPTVTVTDEDSGGRKKRCKIEICNKKKVGLMGFRCRCGGVFCPKHRYPEEHSCDMAGFKEGWERSLGKAKPTLQW